MNSTRRLFSLLLFLALALLAPTRVSHAQTDDRRQPDFNGDGVADLAVGIPRHDILDSRGIVSVRDAGAVNVFYGSFSGIAASGAQIWTQDSTLFNDSVRGTASANDNFGTALAWGDFDNDGFDDLAIGVPGETIGAVAAAGGVNVLYGSVVGLTASRNQLWHQGATWFGGASILGFAETGDAYGSALAAGDFNGDGFDDLAVGVPGQRLAGLGRAGVANVIYGTSGGLRADGVGIPRNQQFSQFDLEGTVEADDQFGFALAAGDFDADGDDDLAIGVPYDSIDGAAMAGAVNVVYGAGAGLTEEGNQFLHQNRPGIKGTAERLDRFGYALAAVDITSESGVVAALVVGIPGESVAEEDDCTLSLSCTLGLTFDANQEHTGAIQVIYGTLIGLGHEDRIFHQGTTGIAGRMEAGDQFGSALAVGDFDGNGTQDVAVGVPWEDVDQVQDAGMIVIVQGGIGGLTAWGSESIHQGAGLDVAETSDRFGAALFSGDFNGDGIDDLAVSVPREDVEAVAMTDAGAVNVLQGSRFGMSSAGAQILLKHAVRLWVGGVAAPAAFDHFGGSGPMR